MTVYPFVASAFIYCPSEPDQNRKLGAYAAVIVNTRTLPCSKVPGLSKEFVLNVCPGLTSPFISLWLPPVAGSRSYCIEEFE